MRFKYPKAGKNNSKVSLHIYDLNKKNTFEIDLKDAHKHYIFQIKFTNDNNTLAVLSANRHQNQVDLSFVNTDNRKSKKIFSEHDQRWIYKDDVTLEFLCDNRFICASDCLCSMN